jgi:ABC-type transport system substrate-binding protein
VIRRACCCVALLLTLIGCDPGGDPVEPSPSPSASVVATQARLEGATLRWAVAEPTGIVPSVAVDESGLLIVDTLFDSLTEVAADGTVLPSAAVEWDSFDGGRRWRFALREGARYHDGTPVTAQDFVDAWSMVVNQGRTGAHLQDVVGYRALRADRTNRLAGVRAIDELTLEVALSAPNMELPAVVAHPSLGPVPPTAVDEALRFTERPVGNGPYEMAEQWAHQQFVRVVRFDGWRNGQRRRAGDRIREIVFRIVDVDAAYVGFQQGRIDIAPVPAGALAQARRTYGDADGATGPGMVDVPLPSLYFLGMRMDVPPWDDPDVRRALSRAIDRQALVQADGDRRVDAAHGLVPPALPGAGLGFCDTCLHLPSLAEAAFRRAGVTTFTLAYDEGGGHEQIVRQIRADLARIDVTVELRPMPFDDYLVALERGEPALYRFGWQAQYASAGAMLEPLLGSGAPTEPGDGANYGAYASDEVDTLIDQARVTEAKDDRLAAWAEVEQVGLRDQAVIPLFTLRQRSVISPRVADLTLTPWGTATPERAYVRDAGTAG